MIIPRSIRRLKEKREHQQGPWAHLFESYKGDEVVSLDCETTSPDVKKAEIRLDLKLRPPASLSGDSIKIHKIRASDLADGIELDEALEKVLEFVGNRPILGYYVNFDIRMLDKFIRPKYGFGLPNKAIELSHVYHDIIKWKHVGGNIDLRFDTIAGKLDIPILERHTALGDAITVALMYVRLRYGESPSGQY